MAVYPVLPILPSGFEGAYMFNFFFSLTLAFGVINSGILAVIKVVLR